MRKLLTYTSHNRSTARQTHHISTIIAGASAVCRRSSPLTIEWSADLNADAHINCHLGEIEDILINLMQNASDSLQTSKVAGPRVHLHTQMLQTDQGQLAQITVTDNGPGIDERVFKRVFEPFFTTKGTTGTGVGLSTSYAVARDHGGDLTCTPGPNTTFTLTLPIGSAEPTAEDSAPEPTTDTNATKSTTDTKAARISVVDDEVVLVRVFKGLCRRFKCDLRFAQSAEQARKLVKRGEQFDLVLRDRSIDNLGDVSPLQWLREHRPSAKIVYCTGHSVTAVDAAEVDGVLFKPFTLADFRETLLLLDGTFGA